MRHAVVVLLLAVAGCAALAPQRDLSRFYTLLPRDAAPAPAKPDHALAVVVGPITLPGYLDRNEVAVRVSPTEVRYAVTDRWAEPLQDGFTRTLITDLASALGSERVVAIGSSAGLAPDFSVEVVVMRFETADDGSALLTARWAVRDANHKVVRVRQSQHQRQAAAATTEGGVKALSAALGDLADEIAGVLSELRSAR